MKKMLCLLMALLLCPVMANAEDSDADLLTLKELTAWAESYIARAMEETPLNSPADSLTADGYAFEYEFATLYADAPVLSADTEVSAVVLTGEEEDGPRHVSVNSDLSEVLYAYYSENAELAGSYDCAVLYTVEQLPESAAWGQVNRDGQRVQTVQYGVHEQLPSGGDGYSDAGVIYTMAENRVSAIRVYGLSSRIPLEDVNDVMYGVMLGALTTDYVQVPFSYEGAALTPLGEGDMAFSGMDFLSLDGEAAIACFGQPVADSWVENGDAGYIRVMAYEGFELTFLYDRARSVGEVYMLLITGDGLEGPRAVRIGDTFASVYNRFRNGEGAYQEDGSELLYGTEAAGDFGKAEYGYDASATVRYGFTAEDGRKVVLKLDFTVMELTQIMLYTD